MSFIEHNDDDRRRLTDDNAISVTYRRSDTGFCRGDPDEGGRRRTMTVPPGLDATQREMSRTRNDFVRQDVVQAALLPRPLQTHGEVLAEGVSLTVSQTRIIVFL